MKKVIEVIGITAFLLGAAGMDSAKVAIPSLMIIGGLTILFITERSLNNG